jgi:hypothetical protein
MVHGATQQPTTHFNQVDTTTMVNPVKTLDTLTMTTTILNDPIQRRLQVQQRASDRRDGSPASFTMPKTPHSTQPDIVVAVKCICPNGSRYFFVRHQEAPTLTRIIGCIASVGSTPSFSVPRALAPVQLVKNATCMTRGDVAAIDASRTAVVITESFHRPLVITAEIGARTHNSVYGKHCANWHANGTMFQL